MDASYHRHDISDKVWELLEYIWPWMRMVCQSESLLQKVPERIVKKLST